MSDQKTPPIVPQDYLSGVKVVDIGDLRVARGMSRRPVSVCKHHQLVYDRQERRIWCEECETDIEPFDAFTMLVEHFHSAEVKHDERERRIQEAEEHSLLSRAAKVVDEAWRSRRMAPCCPHCRGALLPEDFANGIGSRVGLEMARAARARAKAQEVT